MVCMYTIAPKGLHFSTLISIVSVKAALCDTMAVCFSTKQIGGSMKCRKTHVLYVLHILEIVKSTHLSFF